MLIVKPIITEKSMKEAAAKRYTFEVDLRANKTQIKKAVEKEFGVKVTRVRTAIVPGRKYRHAKKMRLGHKPDWKKAVVSIKPDQKIDLFETTNTK